MLWRLHIRPGPKGGKTHEDVIEFCIQNDIAGIGWPVEGNPATAQEYARLAKQTYGNRPASSAFAQSPTIGDHIWARDLKGIYYLGKITGDWAYINSEEALELDIPNQRACHWITIGNEEKVPGKVIACFRPSRAFQAIVNEKLEAFTAWLYVNNGNPDHSSLPPLGKERLFDLIDDRDCEDLIGLFIQQEHNYVLIPSSCKRATIAYEYILKHKETGETAVAQVKHGNVELDERLAHSADTIFLFSSAGQVRAKADNIVVISPQEIIDFCYNKKHIIPDRILNWLNYLN